MRMRAKVKADAQYGQSQRRSSIVEIINFKRCFDLCMQKYSFDTRELFPITKVYSVERIYYLKQKHAIFLYVGKSFESSPCNFVFKFKNDIVIEVF